MWKQKIGISVDYGFGIPIREAIDIIAKSGFDAISPVWKSKEDLLDVASCAKEHGLELQSLHAPHGRITALWNGTEEQIKEATEELFLVLEGCAETNIPIMVCHVWVGFDYCDKPNPKGLGNFDVIVKKAKELGIRIAFENTEGEEFLDLLLSHYKGNETVGFCWDSGHELCYNRAEDLLGRYGDVLIMTHLNDNLGIRRFDGGIYWTDDLHLLPFDGIADWHCNIERLRRSARLEILNFEVKIASKPNRHENDVYMQMKPEVYFAEAYKRACKIAYAYSRK